MIHWRRFTHTHKILYANFYYFGSYIIFIYWICISIHNIYIGKFNQSPLSFGGGSFALRGRQIDDAAMKHQEGTAGQIIFTAVAVVVMVTILVLVLHTFDFWSWLI